jgi:hypothetical protein
MEASTTRQAAESVRAEVDAGGGKIRKDTGVLVRSFGFDRLTETEVETIEKALQAVGVEVEGSEDDGGRTVELFVVETAAEPAPAASEPNVAEPAVAPEPVASEPAVSEPDPAVAPRDLTSISPADVPERTNSSFRDLVELLVPQKINRILDVGGAGFLGETTTVHLIDLFPEAEITVVELDQARADAMREKFGERLQVVNSAVEDFTHSSAFDLIVVDLDTTRMPGVFDLLPGKLAELLASNGFVLAGIFTDVEKAFEGDNSLPAANAPLIRPALEERFGTPHITNDVLKSYFDKDPFYEAIVSVDKWRGDEANFIGWLLLRGRAS